MRLWLYLVCVFAFIGSIGLAITFFYHPASASLKLYGTEYTIRQDAKAWLQLLDASSSPVSTGTCFLTSYYPDGTIFISNAKMNYLSNGIYYYDFITPTKTGVYPEIATCYYVTTSSVIVASNGVLIQGTTATGSYLSTQSLNNVYWKVNEALVGGIYRIAENYTFSGISQSSLMTDFCS